MLISTSTFESFLFDFVSVKGSDLAVWRYLDSGEVKRRAAMVIRCHDEAAVDQPCLVVLNNEPCC